MARPNVVFVFGDQWRAQALGYAGNPVVQTPAIDALAREAIDFTNATSGCPVCTPYRASLITGQYPHIHGCFVNDVPLSNRATSIAQVFGDGGYRTAYIGKWHIDGQGRNAYIPPHRRQGFDYWKVLECTHDYNHSEYFDHDDEQVKIWQGYDAAAQTDDAIEYLSQRDEEAPFLLMLSWGAPHAPYDTAPEKYRRLYNPETIPLRPNVPAEMAPQARQDLAGYYAHCTALDDCMAKLLGALDRLELRENTILVFTSDHGDMLGSQGHLKKQRPWDESTQVPFLLRWPQKFGCEGRKVDALIDAPDILPTLAELANLPVPASAQGTSLKTYLEGAEDPKEGMTLLSCMHPFGQYNRPQYDGREYRGLRTTRYVYTRTLDGPWLLYDNRQDPYQLENLIDKPEVAKLQRELDAKLDERLAQLGDDFLPGDAYIRQWGYVVDETGTVPYAPKMKNHSTP
jgi:arylsulfatase A-like enzyme